MPKISVISIAKKEEELENLRKALANQTFQDFELITSTKERISEAWNDAVSRVPEYLTERGSSEPSNGILLIKPGKM